ncbi:MAG: hypothetical protein ACT4P6_09025 [Gemmatimonadaceae bacterium]
MTRRRDFVRYGTISGSALILGIRQDGDAFTVAKATARFQPNDWIAIDDTGRTVLSIGKRALIHWLFGCACFAAPWKASRSVT